jgi:hypothetical protein
LRLPIEGGLDSADIHPLLGRAELAADSFQDR